MAGLERALRRGGARPLQLGDPGREAPRRVHRADREALVTTYDREAATLPAAAVPSCWSATRPIPYSRAIRLGRTLIDAGYDVEIAAARRSPARRSRNATATLAHPAVPAERVFWSALRASTASSWERRRAARPPVRRLRARLLRRSARARPNGSSGRTRFVAGGTPWHGARPGRPLSLRAARCRSPPRSPPGGATGGPGATRRSSST